MNEVTIKGWVANEKKVSTQFSAEIVKEGPKHYVFRLRDSKQVITIPKTQVLSLKESE